MKTDLPFKVREAGIVILKGLPVPAKELEMSLTPPECTV